MALGQPAEDLLALAAQVQVGEVLESLNITSGKKTATGQISTSKDILLELAVNYELPRLILEYREIEKLKANLAIFFG